MDLRNSNDIELLYKLFRKFSSEVEKCIMWSSIQVFPNQISKKSFYTFEDIDLLERPMQSYINNRVKFWEQIEFKCYKSVSIVFFGNLTDFRCTLRLQK